MGNLKSGMISILLLEQQGLKLTVNASLFLNNRVHLLSLLVHQLHFDPHL